MSLNPIFDATLADAPVNIWQASTIFPRPIEPSLEQSLTRIGHPDFRDWSFINGISMVRSAA